MLLLLLINARTVHWHEPQIGYTPTSATTGDHWQATTIAVLVLGW